MDAQQQVGYATIAGADRASLWAGTAASWVNLHPPGADWSSASDVHGGQQVGFISAAGVKRASLWSGSTASRVDLHAFLPPEFSASIAKGIWRSSHATSVVGCGFNAATMRQEALLWTRVNCYPDCNGDQLLNLADFGCFQTKFALQDPYADCNGDGALNLADFGCFQSKFALGCP